MILLVFLFVQEVLAEKLGGSEEILVKFEEKHEFRSKFLGKNPT